MYYIEGNIKVNKTSSCLRKRCVVLSGEPFQRDKQSDQRILKVKAFLPGFSQGRLRGAGSI